MFTTGEILAIIPFYKRKDQLDKCLAALSHSTVPVTPWVHDNNAANIGFTKACNRGLKAAIAKGSTYALLLNQDCYLRPTAVGGLIGFMESHPRCAIAGPKQLWSQNEDVIIHGGCLEAFPAGRHIGGQKSRGDCAVSRPMPWVNGAALFMRLAALTEIGLMDENMVLVGSDSDICYTARARGWEVWYCADAECVHETGTSMNPSSQQAMAQMEQDMSYWRDKWIGPNLYAKLYMVR